MKRFRSLFGAFLLISACLVTLFISSCNKNDDKDIPQPDIAALMAFNLSPDQPLIGISLSGNQLNSPLPYTSYTGGYVGIYPGKRSAAAFDFSNGNIFASEIFTFEPHKYYSLFVTGANGTYKNIVVNDGLDSINAGSNKSFIRFINAIPDSSKPMITINDGQNDVVKENASFTTVSPFVSVNAGDVNIGINNQSTIQASRTISLEESKAYTVLFLGNPAGSDAADSIQIRYIVNGKLTQDSTEQNLSDSTE